MSNLTLDHFLTMKREWEAKLPPPILAIKCHPATEALVRRMVADNTPAVMRDLYLPPPIYRDNDIPPGKVLTATSRAVADMWRMQEQIKYAAWLYEERARLVTALRLRLHRLRDTEC